MTSHYCKKGAGSWIFPRAGKPRVSEVSTYI